MSASISDKWIRRYFRLAHEIGGWSKDPSTKVGAVVVGDHGQILTQGYNGFPRGVEDLEERLVDRNLKMAYTVHAEMNCIYNASLNGVSLRGGDLFAVGLPVCDKCAPGVIQAGIKRVFMCHELDIPERWQDSAKLSFDMMMEAGIECQSYDIREYLSLVPTQQMRPLRWPGAFVVDPPSTDSTSGSTN